MDAPVPPLPSEQGRLEELYQSVILDHNRRPRNHRAMEVADGRAEGRNPLCGDEITVWVRLEGDTIADISFKGAGCAISRASASIMTTAVKGHTVAEAEALFEQFRDLVTTRTGPAGGEAGSQPSRDAGSPGPLADIRAPETAELRSLAVFSGVARFPVRVKCASLSWHTLRSALRDGAAAARAQ